jgi:hypothetical protein
MTDQGTAKIALDTAGNSYFNGGNVGIGTSTPSAQGLTIFQDGGDRRIMLELNRKFK